MSLRQPLSLRLLHQPARSQISQRVIRGDRRQASHGATTHRYDHLAAGRSMLHTWSPEDIAAQLGVDREQLEALSDYLAWRGGALGPAFRLHDLIRLEPRHIRERQTGLGRLALEYLDAADMVRRFHRELTGELLPDVDQNPPVRRGARAARVSAGPKGATSFAAASPPVPTQAPHRRRRRERGAGGSPTV
jgi:hypothetical protein